LREFGRGCASSTSRVPLKAFLTSSYSFLSNTTCITNRTRIPSDNNIHASTQWVRLVLHLISGSETYVFPGDAFGSEWVMYDVGGLRRHGVCSVLHQQRLNPPC
jgi:hypothetical protein